MGNIGLIITLLTFLFVAFCLLTGKIASSVACGIGVLVLWFASVISEQEAFSNFVSSNIIIMVCMQIVTAALLKTDLLTKIAGLVTRSKGGERILIIAILIVPFFLCQFIGGVTAMITVIPLAMALAYEINVPPSLLVLSASAGAQAGLMALPIGFAAGWYLTRVQMAANLGIDAPLGFWDICLVRMPGIIAVFLFIIFFGNKLAPRRDLANEDLLAGKKLVKSSLPAWKQNVIYAIFIAVILSMSFSSQLHVTNTQIAMAAALLVAVLGFVPEREMYSSVNWSLIFMMAFMLAITTALSNSGAGEILAQLLQPVYGSGSVIIATSVTFIVCVTLTQFMDNSALANIFIPVCILAADKNGIDVLPVIMAVEASCVLSFTSPLASPSSLLAYKLGGFSIKEMLRFNVPLVVLVTIISIIWIPLYFS